MGVPNPASRTSAVLRTVRRVPRTHGEIAAMLGCDVREVYSAVHNLEQRGAIRRVYKPNDYRQWWALDVNAPTPMGYLDAPPTPGEAAPSLSAKALLRRAMAERGVTQGDLSRMTGIAQPHISAALSDVTGEPTWGTVTRLLEAMEYELDLVDARDVAETW